MILFDFRYQDPWAEDTIVFPNFIEQTQSRQRQDQQADINRQTLDTLLTKLSQRDLHQSLIQHGIDHAYKSGNVGSCQIVAGFAVFRGHIQTILVDVFHNGL